MTLTTWRRSARRVADGSALLMVLWLAIFGVLAPWQEAQARQLERDSRGVTTVAPFGMLISYFSRSLHAQPPPGSGGGGPENWTAGGTIEGAALPLTKLTTSFTLNSGTVHNVTTLAEMNTALTAQASQNSPRIVITASFDVSSSITPPARTGTGDCQIISTDFNTATPPKDPGERVVAGDTGSMKRIRTTAVNTPIFVFNHSASPPKRYRLIGLELTTTVTQQGALIEMHGNTATEANIPESIGVDRCYIYGVPGTNWLRRGVQLDGKSCYALDSTIKGCVDEGGSDSQAILMGNAPGPLKVVNNTLEAAGENIMCGGVTSFRTPSDIEFGFNDLSKPEAWNGVYVVKNNFELKFARRMYVYGCIFDRCWVSGQNGMAINIQSTAQVGDGDGAQYKTSDIIITHTVIREYQIPFIIVGAAGDSTQTTDRVVLRQCLFAKQRSGNGGGLWSASQGALNGAVARNCTIETNQTFWHYEVDAISPAVKGDHLKMIDCLGECGLSPDWTDGPFGRSGNPGGSAALAASFNAYTVTGNAFRGDWTTNVVSGNTMSTATTWANIFVNYASGDYAIAGGNWAKGVAAGGLDPGCDWAAVSAATQYTISGQRPSEV